MYHVCARRFTMKRYRPAMRSSFCHAKFEFAKYRPVKRRPAGFLPRACTSQDVPISVWRFLSQTACQTVSQCLLKLQHRIAIVVFADSLTAARATSQVDQVRSETSGWSQMSMVFWRIIWRASRRTRHGSIGWMCRYWDNGRASIKGNQRCAEMQLFEIFVATLTKMKLLDDLPSRKPVERCFDLHLHEDSSEIGLQSASGHTLQN